MNEFNGDNPYEGISKIEGIGPYTGRSHIAFNLAQSLRKDGNVSVWLGFI